MHYNKKLHILNKHLIYDINSNIFQSEINHQESKYTKQSNIFSPKIECRRNQAAFKNELTHIMML